MTFEEAVKEIQKGILEKRTFVFSFSNKEREDGLAVMELMRDYIGDNHFNYKICIHHYKGLFRNRYNYMFKYMGD